MAAGSEINLYAVGDVDLTALMNTVDLQRVTFQGLSLTNYDNTSLPAIAAGSLVEVAGALFKFASEEAITGWGSVAVGAAYIKLVPAGTDPDTVTAEFTDIVPSWVDAKQGWYGIGGAANHRYVATLTKIDAATYAAKDVYNGRYGERPMVSRVRVTKNDAQVIPEAGSHIIEYDDEEYDNLDEFANYRFTAKATGYYFVSASCGGQIVAWLNGEWWQVVLYKNGGAYAKGNLHTFDANINMTTVSMISTLIYFVAGEYIEIKVNHNRSGGNVSTTVSSVDNYFSVHRLS